MILSSRTPSDLGDVVMVFEAVLSPFDVCQLACL